MKIDNLFKDVDKDFELELGFTQVDILDFRGKEPDLEFIEERKREDVVKWLETPQKFEKKLIEISKYCYMVSPHYRRICDYFREKLYLCIINNDRKK